MRRFLSKIVKFILGLIVIGLGLVLIYNRFFTEKGIIIVHNNQYVNNIEYAITMNNAGIYMMDMSRMDLDDAENSIENASGIIFAGGEDFDPSLYGSNNEDLVENYNSQIDQMELAILDRAIKEEIPILGICRGMQLINIYYGGNLYEDLPSQFSDQITHRIGKDQLSYHNVNIEIGSRLHDILGDDYIEVNSFHHEGIRDLAKGLQVTARSEDGLIEAIENPYYPYMVGVQWHPEISYGADPYSKRIIDDFMKACKPRNSF
ncbi:MAG: gamma-glutamyl-gamma-aminobutyrate hydrolase family protein [Tissierellia bacterium]|nr:gamma-glutamyl-gamma-aminobutyrate hydrolase family protein [Tissierellia bacterium]